MNKNRKILFIILLVLCFVFVGCNANNSGSDDPVKIDPPKTTDPGNDPGNATDPGTEVTPAKQTVLGIDNIDKYMDWFNGKRVGLITNPTGINKDYQSTIDVLYEKVNLVSLFAPEHGIRGNSEAGGTIGNEIDIKTNLTVYSLYGSNKQPTKEMMDELDVLCIDIQDVGARFYTYIYTMAYAMQACATYKKTFIVFDRPNPVNGVDVQGNLLDWTYSSFIGMYPIVTRHGMTIGEIAKYFNTEFSINCDLKVVKMENYDRTKYYDELNLPWVNPSPNMPTVDTAVVYSGTCLFEGTNLSVGRGTTKPFEFIGAPYINPFDWADKLNSLNLPGVYFRPMYFTPVSSTNANQLCGGVQVHVTDRSTFDAVKSAMAMYYTVVELYPDSFSFTSSFKLLTGVDYIYSRRYTLSELFIIIDADVKAFKVTREMYLIY